MYFTYRGGFAPCIGAVQNTKCSQKVGQNSGNYAKAGRIYPTLYLALLQREFSETGEPLALSDGAVWWLRFSAQYHGFVISAAAAAAAECLDSAAVGEKIGSLKRFDGPGTFGQF